VTSPACAIGPAGPADVDRIAELTVGLPTAEDLMPPGYVPDLAAVAAARGGHGIGEALVRTCLDRHGRPASRAMVVSTGLRM
jgi:hypothetical protein